jgi:uncharacterized protein YdiU (UPF0061 family)
MEAYAPGTVFSSIDRQGRYAFANQPLILGWNLAKLAEALLPLLDPDEARAVDLANLRLDAVAGIYREKWLAVMRAKLGLVDAEASDGALIDDFLSAIEGADWTLVFRRLAGATSDAGLLLPLLAKPQALHDWLPRWRARLAPDAAQAMRRANPAVVPRNHLVEAALTAATAGELAPFNALLAEVQRPFADEAGREAFALPAPQGFGPYVTFCGT